MKKILVACLVLSILSISLASLAYVRADEDARNEQSPARRLTIDTEPFRVMVRSDVQTSNTENHFGILFTVFHGISIRVGFSQEQQVGESEDEAGLRMRIAYVDLKEFNDTNGNGAFDQGTDTVVQTIPLWNKQYTQPTLSNITSDDGKQGWRIASQTTDGLFKVSADLFPQYAVVDGTIVPPTATKITTTITGFPFTGGSKTMVDLQVAAWSKTVVEHESPQLEERIRVRSNTADGFFSVSRTATIDGRNVTVKTSVAQYTILPRWTKTVEQRRENGDMPPQADAAAAIRGRGPFALINIAYPHGNIIVHDPILGVEITSPTPLLTTSLLTGAAITAVALFAVLLYAGRRELARAFSRRQGKVASLR